MDFEEIVKLFANEHSRVFTRLYPAKSEKSGLKEDSLTHDFLTSLRLSKDYSDTVSYEEFPIPRDCYYGLTSTANEWEEEIDALALLGNNLLGIESKYLKTDFDYKKVKSLAWQIVRMRHVFSHPDILPRLVWADDAHGSFLTNYNAFCSKYTRVGLSLCNFWSKKTDIKGLKAAFVAQLDQTLSDVKTDYVPKQVSPFPAIQLDVAQCYVREVNIKHPSLQKKGWHYYVLIYVDRI